MAITAWTTLRTDWTSLSSQDKVSHDILRFIREEFADSFGTRNKAFYFPCIPTIGPFELLQLKCFFKGNGEEDPAFIFTAPAAGTGYKRGGYDRTARWNDVGTKRPFDVESGKAFVGTGLGNGCIVGGSKTAVRDKLGETLNEIQFYHSRGHIDGGRSSGNGGWSIDRFVSPQTTTSKRKFDFTATSDADIVMMLSPPRAAKRKRWDTEDSPDQLGTKRVALSSCGMEWAQQETENNGHFWEMDIDMKAEPTYPSSRSSFGLDTWSMGFDKRAQRWESMYILLPQGTDFVGEESGIFGGKECDFEKPHLITPSYGPPISNEHQAKHRNQNDGQSKNPESMPLFSSTTEQAWLVYLHEEYHGGASGMVLDGRIKECFCGTEEKDPVFMLATSLRQDHGEGDEEGKLEAKDWNKVKVYDWCVCEGGNKTGLIWGQRGLKIADIAPRLELSTPRFDR